MLWSIPNVRPRRDGCQLFIPATPLEPTELLHAYTDWVHAHLRVCACPRIVLGRYDEEWEGYGWGNQALHIHDMILFGISTSRVVVFHDMVPWRQYLASTAPVLAFDVHTARLMSTCNQNRNPESHIVLNRTLAYYQGERKIWDQWESLPRVVEIAMLWLHAFETASWSSPMWNIRSWKHRWQAILAGGLKQYGLMPWIWQPTTLLRRHLGIFYRSNRINAVHAALQVRTGWNGTSAWPYLAPRDLQRFYRCLSTLNKYPVVFISSDVPLQANVSLVVGQKIAQTSVHGDTARGSHVANAITEWWLLGTIPFIIYTHHSTFGSTAVSRNPNATIYSIPNSVRSMGKSHIQPTWC